MQDKIPHSSTNFIINCFATALFFLISYICFIKYQYQVNVENVTAVLLVTIVPIIAHDLIDKRIIRRLKRQKNFSLLRVVTKLTGLYITYAAVAYVYWQMPTYESSFYKTFYEAVEKFLPYLAALAVPYFIIIELYLSQSKDSYWQIGNLFIRQEKPDYRMIFEHAKAWLVKLFFLALMFVFLFNNIRNLTTTNYSNLISHEDS